MKLHHLLKPSSPLSNLPGSPLTYPTFPALQLLLATALLWIPSLNSDRLLSDNLQHLTRGDYKELLELAKVCLGGTIERKKTYSYQLSRPGADHHTRWMSKCLYILKLSLLQHQIDTISPQTKKKINTMASFILFVYIKFWFSYPSLTETLFSTLKSSWKSLDLSNFSCPPTTACYRSSVDSILEFRQTSI